MVLTVTLNPVLEHRFFLNQIILGDANRSSEEKLSAGGKGINISRQLNLLGIDNLAMSFAGGNNGKIFRKILADEKINNVLISTKSETRFSVNIFEKEKQKVTTFFSPNSEITSEEVELFKEKFIKIVPNSSIVVFSGSSPSKCADEFLCFAIDYANSLDKVTILDTYGNHLQSCIDVKPMMFHANVSEVENSLGVDLSSDGSKKEFLKSLFSKGIKFSFLTDGKNKFYSSQYDFLYQTVPPEIREVDSTGSGDAFVAGLIYGFQNSMIFQDILKSATALGAINASMLETCAVSGELIEKYMSLVQISTVGKKLKIINDSPEK